MAIQIPQPDVPLFQANRAFGGQEALRPVQLSDKVAQEDFGPQRAQAQYRQQINSALISSGFQLAQSAIEAGEEIRFIQGKQTAVNGEVPLNQERMEELRLIASGGDTDEPDDFGGYVYDAQKVGESINSFAELDIVLNSVNPAYRLDVINAAKESIYENASQKTGILGRGRFRNWFENEAIPEYTSKAAVDAAARATRIETERLAQTIQTATENGDFNSGLEAIDKGVSVGLYTPREAAFAALALSQNVPLASNENQIRKFLANDNPEEAERYMQQLRDRVGMDQAEIDAVRRGEAVFDPTIMSQAQMNQMEEVYQTLRGEHITRRRAETSAQIDNSAAILEQEIAESPQLLTQERILQAGFLDHDTMYAGQRGIQMHRYYTNLHSQILKAGEDGDIEQFQPHELELVDRLNRMRAQSVPADAIRKEWMDYVQLLEDEGIQMSQEMRDNWWPKFRNDISSGAYGESANRAFGDIPEVQQTIDATFDELIEEADGDINEISTLNEKRNALSDSFYREAQGIITDSRLSYSQKQNEISQLRTNVITALLSDRGIQGTSFSGRIAAGRGLFRGEREALDVMRRVENGEYRGIIFDVAGIDDDTYNTIMNLAEYKRTKLEQEFEGIQPDDMITDSTGETSFFFRVMSGSQYVSIDGGPPEQIPGEWSSDFISRDSPLLTRARSGALQQINPDSQDQFIEITYRRHPQRGGAEPAVYDASNNRWVFIKDDPGLRESFSSVYAEPARVREEEVQRLEREARFGR